MLYVNRSGRELPTLIRIRKWRIREDAGAHDEVAKPGARENGFCASGCIAAEQFGTPVTRSFEGNAILAFVCNRCGYLGFPPPPQRTLMEYYSNKYARHSSWYNPEADYAHHKVRARADFVTGLMQRYEHTRSLPILEIGCAFGGTVMELRRRGYSAFGMDFNPAAIAEGRTRGNSHIYPSIEAAATENPCTGFGLVYAYHVLEHVAEPSNFLKQLLPFLANDAVLVFRVPNAIYLRAVVAGYTTWNWFAYPDHLHLFSPRSLLCLASDSGFEVLDVTTEACGEPSGDLAALLQPSSELTTEDASEIWAQFMQMTNTRKELCFEFCIKDSGVASQFASCREKSRKFCLRSEIVENLLMQSLRPRVRAPA